MISKFDNWMAEGKASGKLRKWSVESYQSDGPQGFVCLLTEDGTAYRGDGRTVALAIQAALCVYQKWHPADENMSPLRWTHVVTPESLAQQANHAEPEVVTVCPASGSVGPLKLTRGGYF